MPGLVEPDALDAWRSFLESHAAVVTLLEAEMRRRGLVPLTWYDVLVAVAAVPDGRLRMRDIASHLVLTRTNATRLVDRLEKAGLVRRERLDSDRRGAVAVLTPAGRRALRKSWPVYAEGINRLFVSVLAPAELRVLRAALGRVDQRARAIRQADVRLTPPA